MMNDNDVDDDYDDGDDDDYNDDDHDDDDNDVDDDNDDDDFICLLLIRFRKLYLSLNVIYHSYRK
jgi:hypothetical protein